jgi:hypothetical protein
MIQLTKYPETFCDKLSVFGSEGFLKTKSNEYGWLFDECFVTPFVIDNRGGFRRFVIMNEPIAFRDASIEDEKKHLDDVCRYANLELKVDFLSGHTNAIFRVVPDSSISIDWGTYMVALEGDEENLLKNMNAAKRTAVRKAIRAGVEVYNTNDIGEIFEVLKSTMTRQKEFYYPSIEYLYRLKENLGENVSYFVCRHDGKVQGGVVMLHNNLRGYYYYGGSIERPIKGSIPLLQLEVMKCLKKNSVSYYDLVGARLQLSPDSKFIGIQEFKHSLGGKLHVGKTFKVIFRPLRFTIYQLMLNGYFRLKGGRYKGDIIDQVRKAAAMPDVVFAPGT